VAVELTVDVREFADMIPRLMRATGKSLSAVVKQQARLIVRGSGEGGDEGLIPYTPPPKGQEQGKKAVERDINRVFLTAKLARSIMKSFGARGMVPAFNRALKTQGAEAALNVLKWGKKEKVTVRQYTALRKGRTVQIRGHTKRAHGNGSALGIPALMTINSVSETPDPNIHKLRKTPSTGRVRKQQWSQLILQNGSLTAYIKQIQKRVGITKAGWRAAATALSVTMPSFVRDAPRASGSVRLDLENENPSVVMTNETPNLARSIQGVLDRTIAGRRMRMAADINRKLAAELSKLQAAA
jgi:hypothetical protein